MEGDILDVVVDIKKKYLNLNVSYVNQCSLYNLKGVTRATLELEERVPYCRTERLINNTVRIAYSGIFNWYDHTGKKLDRKVLLVEGEAGIGKTALCASIAKDWASGELFQEFMIVLLLPLYQRKVAVAYSLPKMLSELYSLDEKKCHIVASYLRRSRKQNVLIIADGLYEMGQSGHCEDSFLHKLLFGNLLPSSSVTVMVTSRPDCVHFNTLKNISRFVSVKGFSIQTAQSCIQSEFNNHANKASYLVEQLDNNPLLRSMCSVPLNLAMILNICQYTPYDRLQPLPDTMTDLYTKMCWAHAETSIKSMEQYRGVMGLSNYHDLPKDLQQSWWLLCELAFRLIESGSNTFSQLETARFISTEVLSFGFLKPVSEDDMVFNFLHPTFKEYFAALHLVKQPQGTQLEFIKVYSECQTLSCYFWQFFFGMYVSEVLEVKVNDIIIVQAVQMLSKLHRSGNNEYLLCHYSFEAKCKLVNDEVTKSLNTTKHGCLPMTLNFSHARNVHDCTAMMYIIESIDQQCCVEINFQKCGLNCQHINKLASALSCRADNIQVKGLDLSDNLLDDSAVADLFHRAAATLQSLEKLFLRRCSIKEKTVSAIMNALANSSSPSLKQLDLSYNPLSKSCFHTLQQHIGTLSTLEILLLKGSLLKDVSLGFLASFKLMDTVSYQCEHLRQLDLSDNYLGKSDNPALRKMILQLTNTKRNLNLCLNDEYMPIVDENFIRAVEESIREKGTIDHTVAHGIIVGPGRSGKNTLMNRLMGKGPPNPDSISSSTGVLEKVVKIEVKKLCTVAATACNLKWHRLEYDEEALELMMTTAKYSRLVSSPSPKSRCKFIIKKQPRSKSLVGEANKELSSTNPKSSLVAPKVINQTSKACQTDDSNSVRGDGSTNETVFVCSSDVAPVELFKKALKLRKLNGLREQLESSWSLYLTNTGGQPEFQEYLPFLISGPTVFFITFPLHCDLNKPYNVQYQYPDGQVKSYPSSATLLEELLQTLATINALSYTGSGDCDTELNIKPKVYFIGTHKDCLRDAETIHVIDKQIQTCVKQTSLYRQGSIQFAQSSKQMIFTVNNLSEADGDFQAIRSAVEQTVTKKCVREFTVKCPTSWLVFSLILKEKYQSYHVLHFNDCLMIAQECGISSSKEMKQALSFIHSRLGLVRYFDVEELDTLVIVDPQIIFDKITELIVSTFISDHAEENEIEDFKHKGIFSEALMEKVSDKCSSNLQLPPLTWLTKLLNYLQMAALFKDRNGARKYFFPSALSHAPELDTKQALFQSRMAPPVVITFESGFCPRGVPGALIKCLMTNEMKSKQKWELLPHKIYRNRVSFHIQACGIITLKILHSHLEICLESKEDTTLTDSKTTCEEACTQMEKCMKIVTSQYIKCKYFWRFYCTVTGCKTDPHPAEIEWRGNIPKQLWCKVSQKCGNLPKGHEMWNIQRKQRQKKSLGALDKEIDENGVPMQLGQIANFMDEWEGRIADHLELTIADVASIKKEYPSKLSLQMRAALLKWKEKLGKSATYNKLISSFEAAGYKNYADNIKRMFGGDDETDNSSDDESFPSPQPPTYPVQIIKPLSSTPEPSMSVCEPFYLIDSDTAKRLPKGDLHDCDLLQDLSASVTFLPQLSTLKPQHQAHKPQPQPQPTVPPSTGIQRGKCTSLGCECEQYRTVSSGGRSSGGRLRCEYCNHTPVEHVKIIELGVCSKCKASGEDCEKYESDDPNSYTDCAYCGCSASYHAGAEKLHKPQPTVLSSMGAAASSTAFVTGAGGFQPQVDVYGLPTQSAHLGTCKLPGCQFPRRFEGNKVHEFCSRTCTRRYAQMMSIPLGEQRETNEASMSPLPANFTKCAIEECVNPCYVDDEGKVHECCGFIHAMEHQRRLAIMKQIMEKGVTQCYLPGCNRFTWPFQNYCCREHEELGKKMGLPSPSLTSTTISASTSIQNDSSMCLLPGCTRPKYVDTMSGITRDYCCSTHATQAAVASKRVNILTSKEDVLKFLKKFPALSVVSLKENSHAKPPTGILFRSFKKAYDQLPHEECKTCLAFHGTSESNIDSICKNGYDPKLRGTGYGQAYGAGEYFNTDPSTSLSYCRGAKKMILNELLLGQNGVHHTQHGSVIVMKYPDHELPRYVITFK